MNKFLSITLILASSILCYAEKAVTFRINDAYAPFEYINKEGEPSGFTIDIFNAINQELKFNHIVKTDKRIFNFYSTVIDSTELVTSIDSLPADNRFIASKPYGYVDNDVVTRLDSDINSWEDMNGRHVLIVKDSPMIEIAKKRNVKPKFIFIRNVPDGLRLLSSGKYDAMICSNDAAYAYIDKLNLSNLSVKPLFCQPLAIRFVMLNTPLNQEIITHINNAIRVIKTNGVYDKIYSQRFFTYDEELSLPISSTHIYIILIIFVSLLVIYFIIFFAQRKNRRNISVSSSHLVALENIYQTNPTPTIVFDSNGYILFANKACQQQFPSSQKKLESNSLFKQSILNDEVIEKLQEGIAVNVSLNLIGKENASNQFADIMLPRNNVYDISIIPLPASNGFVAYIQDATSKHISDFTNHRLIVALSQITDNNLLSIYFYDREEDHFYSFAKNIASNTGVTHEKAMTYIHPLYRSHFIDEFLSILNGEKQSCKIRTKKLSPKTQKYVSCEVILNAIRSKDNTTTGVAIASSPIHSKETLGTTNGELQEKLNFLSKSSEHYFFEFTPATQKMNISIANGTLKAMDFTQMCDLIHYADRNKAISAIQDLQNHKVGSAYLLLRILSPSTKQYQYYSIHLHTFINEKNDSEKIVGVYQDITDNTKHIRELEEFKESILLACETYGLGYFEYSTLDTEHEYIPTTLSEKYGIDDDNMMKLFDEESRTKFLTLINQFNEHSHNFECPILRFRSPVTNTCVELSLSIIPVCDDIYQETYKYIGLINDKTTIN